MLATQAHKSIVLLAMETCYLYACLQDSRLF